MGPDPVTTGAVKVSKTKPRLRLHLPATVRKGTRPEVWLNVTARGAAVSGVAQVRVGKGRAVRAKVRHGFARFHLPKVGLGSHKVRATFLGSARYQKATVTKRLKVIR